MPFDPDPSPPERDYFAIYGQMYCDICGEELSGEVAEMYDPHNDSDNVIVHAQCGLSAGLSVA